MLVQSLAVYFNQDTVQFDGSNVVCEERIMSVSSFTYIRQPFLVRQIHERNE